MVGVCGIRSWLAACRTSNEAISAVWWRPGRAERRKRASALSADFTPEGAQVFFDYRQQ